MPSHLHNRLGKLEREIAPENPRKFVQIVASDEGEERAYADAEAEGFGRDDVFIIRLVGVPVPDHIMNAR